jgi:hypothetical protein
MLVVAAAGAVATWLNPVNLLSVGVAGVWLSVRSPGFDALLERVGVVLRTRGLRRTDVTSSGGAARPSPNTAGRGASARAAGFLVGGGIIGAAAWSIIARLRETIDPNVIPQNRLLAVHGLPRALLAPRNLFGWFPPLHYYDAPALSNAAVEDFRQAALFLFVGALILAALRLTRRDSIAVLGAVTGVAALVGAPLYMVFGSVIFHVETYPLARYGLALIPAMALVVAWSASGRFGQRILVAFAGAAYVTVLLTIVLADVPAVVH